MIEIRELVIKALVSNEGVKKEESKGEKIDVNRLAEVITRQIDQRNER